MRLRRRGSLRPREPPAPDHLTEFDDGVLRTIMSFVGPHERLFTSSINENWLRLYREIDAGNTSVTSCVAAMRSRSRLLLALNNGLNLAARNGLCCEAAGATAPHDVIRLARSRGLPWTSEITAGAAGAGRLETFEWLVAGRCPVDYSSIREAMRAGHGPMVQHLWNYRQTWPHLHESYFNDSAAASGQLRILMWLVQNQCALRTSLTAEQAAEHGHLHILNWVWRRNNESWIEAAEGNVDNVLQEERSLHIARAGSGHVSVLRWLNHRGLLRHGMNLITSAAAVNATESIIWLLSVHHEQLQIENTTSAARCGSTEALQVLINNNCPVANSIVYSVIRYGTIGTQKNMVQWLYERGLGDWTPAALHVYRALSASRLFRADIAEFLNSIQAL